MHTSFDTLHKEHISYITRLARRFARGSREDAQDLAQEAWLALLQTPEERWTEKRYVHTVVFRVMHRWLLADKVQRVIAPANRELRRPQQLAVHAYGKGLRLRRNTPRPNIQPETPARLRAA